MCKPAYFILLPLYMWADKWQPLIQAAKAFPSVPIKAIINPDSGPIGKCPPSDYVDGLAQLNALPNVNLLGYVHTANAWDCGSSGNDICACSQPQDAVMRNVSYYANWPKANCSPGNTKDIHVDGIFFDEAPGMDTNSVYYMQGLTNFTKNSFPSGHNTVMFNAGAEVADAYWKMADYVNVFENDQSTYESTDVNAMTGGGAHAQKATMLIYGNDPTQEVQIVQKLKQDAIAGVFVSDRSSNMYTEWSGNFAGFVAEVAAVLAL